MISRHAGEAALIFGLFAMLTSFIAFPLVLIRMRSIQRMLDDDMSEFKTISLDSWKNIIILQKSKPSVRISRQTSTAACQCDETNNCPPGSIGLMGFAGMPGFDGRPGGPGEPGKPGVAPEAPTADPIEKCRQCPQGEPGIPGSPGPPGPPGFSGENGINGKKGLMGRPGQPGSRGAPGSNGKDGDVGSKGPIGRPGLAGGKGKRGPKGSPGRRGQQGPPGIDSRPALPGPRGKDGETGPQGPPGKAGIQGHTGVPGSLGQPGTDAQYCPCPLRQGSPNLDSKRPVITKPPRTKPTTTAKSIVVETTTKTTNLPPPTPVVTTSSTTTLKSDTTEASHELGDQVCGKHDTGLCVTSLLNLAMANEHLTGELYLRFPIDNAPLLQRICESLSQFKLCVEETEANIPCKSKNPTDIFFMTSFEILCDDKFNQLIIDNDKCLQSVVSSPKYGSCTDALQTFINYDTIGEVLDNNVEMICQNVKSVVTLNNCNANLVAEHCPGDVVAKALGNFINSKATLYKDVNACV